MKKPVAKTNDRPGDQYMLRMPAGMRERVAERAAANGRSMSSEIIDAIEKHLQGADRVTELWDFVERYRGDIESMGLVYGAVEDLESFAESLEGGSFRGRIHTKYRAEQRAARVAALPLITKAQADEIRAALRAADRSEEKLLRLFRVARIEDIREFDRAMTAIQQVDPPR